MRDFFSVLATLHSIIVQFVSLYFLQVVDQPPERDSVAFEKGIDNNDKTLMDAQGRVAQGQQRHIRSNYDGVPSTIVIKEDYFNNDGSDV